MLDSVTVAGEIKDFTFENQSVEDRCGDDRVAQEVGPIVKAFVGRQHQRFILITIGDKGKL